uniref:Ig-like domain-containing protein n=1 Tax=Dromaius novaehollandiae TaxID=8790 RepID=A0A8C4KDC9_DRONO
HDDNSLCCAAASMTPRAKITQTSGLVLKEDEKATLTCVQNDNHSYMSCYLQQPEKGLQLVYYSTGVNQEQEGDIHSGYKVNQLNLTDFYLHIVSVKMNHSALYFCASSLDTTLQSHLLSLHKPLSFHQNRVSLSSSAGQDYVGQ